MAGTVAASAPAVHRPQGVKRIEVALTCDASGVVSEAVIGEAYGRLVGVFYDGGLDASATVSLKQKPGAASTVSVPVFTHTTGTEGTPVRMRPTDIATDNAGVNVTAADTAPNVNRDIIVAGKLTVTVASGGVSETGKYAFIIDETPPRPTVDAAITV
jgi:hypothetical protein